MNLNLLKELHEDLRKVIIDEYVKKYNLSIGDISIYQDQTIINYNIKDEKGDYVTTEKIELSNKSWIIKE